MMMRNLLAGVIGQHKFDLDASLVTESVMACTCGQRWPDDQWSDERWNLHIADALLSALKPTCPPEEHGPEQLPLFETEEE
jgi:hypothetical protein